jgi:hypothetical protein
MCSIPMIKSTLRNITRWSYGTYRVVSLAHIFQDERKGLMCEALEVILYMAPVPDSSEPP